MYQFTLEPVMLPLLINLVVMIITLLYGCREDIRERAVPVVMWYPVLAIGVVMLAWFFYSTAGSGDIVYIVPLLPLIIFFCVAFYLFTRFNLMGMGDTKALVLITVLIPCYPFMPLGGYPALGYPPYVFLPFSVLVNSVILNLAIPVCFFLMNLIKGNRAPLPYLFLGYPVPGSKIEEHFGVVMEEFSETDGQFSRKFIGIGAAIQDMLSGGDRVYTKDLKEEPDRYKKELELYRKAGHVWISYGVPFLIPITAGLITAVLFGDILTLITGIFT